MKMGFNVERTIGAQKILNVGKKLVQGWACAEIGDVFCVTCALVCSWKCPLPRVGLLPNKDIAPSVPHHLALYSVTLTGKSQCIFLSLEINIPLPYFDKWPYVTLMLLPYLLGVGLGMDVLASGFK